MIPDGKEDRHDIIQAVEFHDPEKLIAFCEGIQKASPIDSHVTPIPWDMPGYDSQVIMAAGTFVSGASIELSADGPMKELMQYIPGRSYISTCQIWNHHVPAANGRKRFGRNSRDFIK